MATRELQSLPWPDGEFLFAPGFWSPAQAGALATALVEGCDWRQHTVRMFGRDLPAPRQSAWHGDAGADYRYSGQRHRPRPWTPVLVGVRDDIEQQLGLRFNAVLANRYRDGNDAMGWHSDDEPELGPAPVIASASFGAARRFRLRHRDSGRTEQLVLGHGSLLVMAGASQRHWQHALPRTRVVRAPRINLTFRRILAAGGTAELLQSAGTRRDPASASGCATP